MTTTTHAALQENVVFIFIESDKRSHSYVYQSDPLPTDQVKCVSVSQTPRQSDNPLYGMQAIGGLAGSPHDHTLDNPMYTTPDAVIYDEIGNGSGKNKFRLSTNSAYGSLTETGTDIGKSRSENTVDLSNPDTFLNREVPLDRG